ncbi:hypothetical protein [Metabacillus litoralis]|uniref:hypothetical protein n=1 Tax=Metabacillus litoralis TaxID=152268 RepID=UPI001CFD4C4C|nr:hypothetical protein [Metabacillus litoralis]
MRKFYIQGQEMILTCSRNVDYEGFNRAYEKICNLEKQYLQIEKATVIILVINNNNEHFVIERMNTDTFTLHIHYHILREQVYNL